MRCQATSSWVVHSPEVSGFKSSADSIQPGIEVLSYAEILKDVRVEALGMVAAE